MTEFEAMTLEHPDLHFHPLGEELLEAEARDDRRAFLAEVGQKALAEAPLHQRLDAISAGVAALQAATPKVRNKNPDARLLSKAAACRALGIDRSTLDRLISDKHVRTVPAPHGSRVPRTEIDRLLIEGIPRSDAAPRRRPPQPPPAPGVGRRIAALRVS